jgi:Na+/melibiose symporter-like transporter
MVGTRPAPASAEPTRHDPARRPGSTLLVASLGTFAALIAYTGPLGNLPTVASALHAGPSAQTWILSSISVALAASLLTLGALADDYGRRRAFMWGSAVLGAGSILCAVAGGADLFIVGRLVQGVGAAAVIASSLGLVARVFTSPAQRAKASGAWGASVGAGIAIGPLATGLLDLVDAWRVFYWLLGAGVLLLAVAGRRVLTESVAASPRPVDIAGALTLGGALVLALVGLVEGRHGITELVAWVAPGAAILAVAFILVEHRRRHPMLDLSLFRHRPFSAVTVAALATGVSLIGVMSFSCSFLITTMHLSSLGAGVLLFAWSGTSAVAALLARRLPARLAGSRQLAIGLFGVGVGEVAMLDVVPGSAWRLLPGLVIAGIASGVLNAGLGRQAIASVPADRASLGSGANNTSRYLGSSIGVTLVVIIATGSGGSVGARISAWNHAVLVSAVIAALSAIAVLALQGRDSVR